MKTFKDLIMALVISTVAASAAVAQKPEPVWIQDSQVLVVVPENRKVVTAYSCVRGIWSKIKLSTDLDADVKPAVNQGMVALKSGRTIYAYSAQTASWDMIVLRTNTDAMFTIQENAITVKDGHSLYIFGVHAQAWSGVDLRTGELIDINRLARIPKALPRIRPRPEGYH